MQETRRVVIATRESRLALWQAEHVQAALRRAHPGIDVVIDGMTTQGDRVLDKTLSKIGGKGLFVKELETALLDGSADIAVHSLKDVPMSLAPGLRLGAIMEREDARDAFVSNRFASPDDLPDGAVIGTASLRRESQFRAAYPHVTVVPARGNVGTRLDKLDRGDFDAMLLATAGLLRLGLQSRIRLRMDPSLSLPSPGQGAVAIEIADHRDDLMALLAPLHDRRTSLAVLAERAVSRTLGGNCTMPLGAYATWTSDDHLELSAVLGRPDGTLLMSVSETALVAAGDDEVDDAEELGRHIGELLIGQGALSVIESL
ncbi:MAG: hydroxymethylbilane synthase [Burkholderiaceae bacterium]